MEETHIEDIPAEVWSFIFSFLCDDEGTNMSDSNNTRCILDINQAMRVCKRWREIILVSGFLWKRLCWKMIPMGSESRKDPKLLQHILQLPQFTQFLREIDLVRPGRGILHLLLLESSDLIELCKFTPKLTSLQVKISDVDNATLKALATLCPSLQHLVLISETAKFTSEGFSCISNALNGLKTFSIESSHMNMSLSHANLLAFVEKHGSTLTDLNLQSFHFIRPDLIKALAERCSSLTSLKLKVNTLSPEIIESLFTKATGLSELVIECWQWPEACTEAIVQNAKSLESLKLSLSKLSISSNSFTMLGRLKHPLKILHFICEDLNSDWIFENPTFWKSIEDLDLSKSKVGDEGLQLIAQQCNNLNFLYLNGCRFFTEAGLNVITKANPNITKLGLCRCCVNDQMAEVVANNCSKLQFFMTNNKGLMSSITNRGLLLIIKNCPELLRMDLTAQFQMDDESMANIVEYCPRLQFLKLTSCNVITDNGLKILAKGCPDLHVLDIANLTEVTDASMEAIATGSFANRLWLLNAKSTEITDEGIIALDRGCPAINRITAQMTQGVTEDIQPKVKTRLCRM